MGDHITLMGWSGKDDQGIVAGKMAKVFRIDSDNASQIIQRLIEGNSWKFDRQVSDQQARIVKKYLAELGFEVALDSEEALAPPETGDLTTPEEVSASSPGTDLDFHGDGKELFKIVFVNQILTVLTLGIYYFWAKTKTRLYIYGSTSLGGDRFSYHGTGKELFKGGMFFAGIIIGLVVLSAAMTMILGPGIGEFLEGVVTLLIVLVFPALMVGAFRYRLSRTAWRTVRFSFRGVRMDALKMYTIGTILTILTLGFYFPIFAVELQKFWRGNAYFGNMPFKFSGDHKEIYGKYIVGIILTVITFGIYGFWLRAFLQQYYWSKTHLGKGAFHFDATGGEIFMLNLVNMLILIFTLGLGFAWVIVRNMKFLTDHLSLKGNIDVNKVLQEMKKSGALGEEALDAFDVPLDVI